MNKPYGFAASVTPSTEFHEEQPIVLDGIEISVHAGHLEVGYDHEEDEHKARRMARILVDAWRARTRVALEVGFDQAATWKPNSQGGKDMAIPLSDQATATDRLCVTRETTGENGEPVVIESDSYSILNDVQMTVKALNHKPLEDALRFYSQEGLDPKRPLYGIFKAIESITKRLPGGRKELGKLAGEPESTAEKFVGDVMQTANSIRHSNPTGGPVLSEQECKDRAYILICAYADSLP